MCIFLSTQLYSWVQKFKFFVVRRYYQAGQDVLVIFFVCTQTIVLVRILYGPLIGLFWDDPRKYCWCCSFINMQWSQKVFRVGFVCVSSGGIEPKSRVDSPTQTSLEVSILFASSYVSERSTAPNNFHQNIWEPKLQTIKIHHVFWTIRVLGVSQNVSVVADTSCWIIPHPYVKSHPRWDSTCDVHRIQFVVTSEQQQGSHWALIVPDFWWIKLNLSEPTKILRNLLRLVSNSKVQTVRSLNRP